MADSGDVRSEETITQPADTLAGGLRAEDTLPQGASLFRTLFLGHPDGVALIVRGRIALINERLAEMSGYSTQEAIGMNPSDLVVPEDQNRLRDRIQDLHEQGDVYPSTYTLLRKDGSRLSIDAYSSPIQHDGETVLISVLRDVSEREVAEEARRESEARYRTLYELASDAFLTVLEDGEIIDANIAAEDLLGYTLEELRGLTGNMIIAPEVLEEAEQAWRAQLEEHGQFLVETVWVRKDGSRIPIAVSGRPVMVGDQQQLQLIGRDITNRKKAEEALRESEATNKALLMAIPDMIFRLTRDGTYVDYVPGTAARPLVAPSEFMGRNVREILPAVADEILRAIEQAFESDETQTVSYEVIFDDGLHSFETRINVCSDEEVLAIVRDVTKEKQAEDALRALEQERYRRLLEIAPDGIVIVDGAGVIETVNSQMEELFGYDRKELIGRPIEMLIPERFRQQHVAHRQAYTAAPRARSMGPDLDLFGLRKDGTTFPIDVSLNALQTETGVSVIASVRDVTERVEAEDTLRESEARFSTAFHDNPVPVTITRARDGKVIDLNDAFLRMTGYRRAEVIGRTSVEIGIFMDPGVREEVVVEVRERGTVRDLPVQIKKKTDEVLDILATITQIELEGEPCLLITNVDITERKRLEQELQNMRDDVESKVERRMEGDNPYRLTFREFTVLHLIAAGKADKEIAVELTISIYTVHRHVSHILTKMDSRSRTEAGTRALREGLLE